MHWLHLTIAIVSRGDSYFSAQGCRRLHSIVPFIAGCRGYASAFYFLSLTLRTIPLGVSYAVWSGVGIALVSVIAWILYDQSLDAAALVGIGLIVAGVVVLNVFSKAVPH